ncbi:hypothetical protein ACFFX0_08605 [Citricoccus parietis]|uniref:Uncharacterized protein n=1 Tax=Citricoccus parietis TaxID=592307 RepID=A0ABV5FX50_9MICC
MYGTDPAPPRRPRRSWDFPTPSRTRTAGCGSPHRTRTGSPVSCSPRDWLTISPLRRPHWTRSSSTSRPTTPRKEP